MWYQQAVIYAVDVERFADGNGDGVGDFRGLTSRLGYLKELGVTCLWLLPFYPTPNRDNGYDIRDYYGPRAEAGTLQDFVDFMHAAGEYGMRVIVDLVVNHTSSEHPWFEASRRDEGSRFREYYVWTKTPPPIPPGDRNVFPSTEHSVWRYDETARAYYFHKFYHFEPGLNTDNPQVREEILRIMDFWLSFGVSGFRIDAAPFIVGEKGFRGREAERPEDILREMRKFVCGRRADAVLLGEVNVPADRIANYFGQGDKLNALFNFYLNSNLYLALARQEASPVHAAIRRLPPPPEGSVWANFLRNLDELDLSRLAKEELDEVLRAFAPEPAMRIFGRGIRRRLPPMLGGDRRRLEMAFSIVLSSPGTPVFVYGEEIGMGDDLELPGRDAVRLPMQWADAPNAGFSEAPAERLPCPALDEGPFSYRQVNVASQEQDPKSLLRCMRNLIRLRREHPAIGASACRPLESAHRSVLAYAYDEDDGRLVVAHNLCDQEARCELDLGRGPHRIEDLMKEDEDKVEDRAEARLPITLPAYGYRWYRIGPAND